MEAKQGKNTSERVTKKKHRCKRIKNEEGVTNEKVTDTKKEYGFTTCQDWTKVQHGGSFHTVTKGSEYLISESHMTGVCTSIYSFML